jgi:hypothetical protein
MTLMMHCGDKAYCWIGCGDKEPKFLSYCLVKKLRLAVPGFIQPAQFYGRTSVSLNTCSANLHAASKQLHVHRLDYPSLSLSTSLSLFLPLSLSLSEFDQSLNRPFDNKRQQYISAHLFLVSYIKLSQPATQISFHNFHSFAMHLDIVKVSYFHQRMHYIYAQQYIKICIKIHIKIAPTCFDLTTILREHIIDLS